MEYPSLLDVVVLLVDLPEEKLRKGSLGTVVEAFDDERFLVEFADTKGITYALPVLVVDQILKVYQEPVEA